MKALTVKQPWASLIVQKQKRIETRTWSTNYRGPLVLHAGKTVDHGACYRHDIQPGPVGAAVAIVNLIDCRPMTIDDEPLAKCQWRPGLYAWVLGPNVRPIMPPIPWKGAQGLWEFAGLPAWIEHAGSHLH